MENKNKESKSQQAEKYSLSLKLETNRSKLRGITPSLSNNPKLDLRSRAQVVTLALRMLMIENKKKNKQ